VGHLIRKNNSITSQQNQLTMGEGSSLGDAQILTISHGQQTPGNRQAQPMDEFLFDQRNFLLHHA
jgi:hypothetical protein